MENTLKVIDQRSVVWYDKTKFQITGDDIDVSCHILQACMRFKQLNQDVALHNVTDEQEALEKINNGLRVTLVVSR